MRRCEEQGPSRLGERRAGRPCWLGHDSEAETVKRTVTCQLCWELRSEKPARGRLQRGMNSESGGASSHILPSCLAGSPKQACRWGAGKPSSPHLPPASGSLAPEEALGPFRWQLGLGKEAWQPCQAGFFHCAWLNAEEEAAARRPGRPQAGHLAAGAAPLPVFIL